MMYQRRLGSFQRFSVSHCWLAPIDGKSEPCLSTSFAIEFSFSGHPTTIVSNGGGPSRRRSVRAESGGMTSAESVRWVVVPEPAECVEIRPTRACRESICRAHAISDAEDLNALANIADPVLWAASHRLRAALCGGWPLGDLESDQLIETVLGHLLVRYCGGRLPRRNAIGLDARRLERVIDYVEAHLDRDLALSELADVGAMSRFHFLRAFRATTGLTPHQFAEARRMDRARDLLRRGDRTVGEVAAQVGYSNGHHFRRLFRRHHGSGPGALARTFRRNGT